MSVRAATGLDILLPVMPFLYRFMCLPFVMLELAQLKNWQTAIVLLVKITKH
jgi:hypothetical protein